MLLHKSLSQLLLHILDNITYRLIFLDILSYSFYNYNHMQWQVPPIWAKKNCIGYFQTKLHVGTIHHLTPHTYLMKGDSHYIYASSNLMQVGL